MVQTTPHGEGDVRDHINTEYDSNQDGTIDDIQTDAVGSAEIATDAVGSDEIATDAVGSDEVATGAIGRTELTTLTALDLQPTDLTASVLDPGTEGVFAMHDGTTVAAGLYRSDPSNSQWVKVEDNTVTIAY